MRPTFCLALLAALAAPGAHAQERTAGQTYDAQVNWSALATKIDAVSAQNKALAASMKTLQETLTTLTTTVDALSSKVVLLDSKMSAIATCGAQKTYWNGTRCVAGSAGLPRVESATFTETRSYRGARSNPATHGYCVSRGYDDLAGYTTSTSTRHVGGRTGGEESYISAYHITCMRVVAR